MFANGAHLAESTENSMRDETDSWKTDENADGVGLNFLPVCLPVLHVASIRAERRCVLPLRGSLRGGRWEHKL